MIRKRFGPKKTKQKEDGRRRVFKHDEIRAVEHLAKLGATNEQMGEYFGVTGETIGIWKRNYPKFAKACKRGGIIADMKVAQSLYKRAVGYTYIEEEYSATEVDGMKLPLDQMALVKRTKKKLPPDVKAAREWLRVRQREAWATLPTDIYHHVSGKINHLHQKLQDIPIHELSPAARQMLFEVTQKQLVLSNDNHQDG